MIRILIMLGVVVAVSAWFWEPEVSKYYRDVFRWRR